MSFFDDVVRINPCLVTHMDITWNSFLPYLVTFTDRLEGVGFRYVDGEVFAPKVEISEK